MTRRLFHIALAAGGTGGHVIPAQALAAELSARGHHLVFFTDRRGMRYASLFPEMPVYEVASAPFRSGIVAKVVSALRMVAGTFRALRLIRMLKPAAVVGFGGYPSVPAGLAAAITGLPLCLHEQNAVFGRSNRLLARFARMLTLSFARTTRVPRHPSVHVTGNPVRPAIVELAAGDYEAPDADGEFRLLVIGGSQGATVLSDVVPAAISALPKGSYSRLRIVQQTREEDLERVTRLYEQLGIAAEIMPFVEDLPRRLADAHLVIARAGASTISELSVAGRPAILVPYPAATDDHQTMNAVELTQSGGAWTIAQRDFTPAQLAKLLQGLMRDPQRLADAARAAQGVGRPQAAAELADLVERLIVARGPLAALPVESDERTAA